MMNLNKLNSIIHKYHPESRRAFQYHRTGGTCYIYFRARPSSCVVDTLISLFVNVSIIIEAAA